MKTNRSSLLSPNIKSEKPAQNWLGTDPIKWIALGITLLGVAAWAAGAGFFEGYWKVVGSTRPIIDRSVQQTAYSGFVALFSQWLLVGIFVAAIGIYSLLIEFLSALTPQRKKPQGSPPSKFMLWLRARRKLDPSIKRAAFVTFMGGVTFSLILALPFFLWIYAAYQAGESRMKHDICDARKTTTFHNKVQLSNGVSMVGTILDRSDKLTILLDSRAIYVIMTDRESRLLDATDVQYVKCPTK